MEDKPLEARNSWI